MKNKKDLLIKVFGAITIIVLLTIIVVREPNNMATPSIDICKEDSLQVIINQLQVDLESEENEWDRKEKQYERIIFDYEFGLDYLKDYHGEAYKEFHRIVGYKENYTHEIERDNKQRLKITSRF